MNKLIKIIVITLLCLSFLCLSVSALSRIGSVGDEVSLIQRRLKSLGYYEGEVDGIFGTLTKRAVEQFQTDHNLVTDGIVGEKTLAALGINNSLNQGGYNSEDTELLARIISAEARGESYLGQVAIGAVVLNRVIHPSFPDTVAGVIFENGAFNAVADGQFYQSPEETSYKAASAALDGIDPTGGAIYYFNPQKSKNQWIRKRKVVTTIGNHVFCV